MLPSGLAASFACAIDIVRQDRRPKQGQRPGMAVSGNSVRLDGIAWCKAVLVLLAAHGTSVRADETRSPADRVNQSIVVTAKRTVIPDAVVTRRIETVLHDDPFFYGEHVTMTVKNGVARRQGVVSDDWDLRVATHTTRRIPGLRRVVNECEISSTGSR